MSMTGARLNAPYQLRQQKHCWHQVEKNLKTVKTPCVKCGKPSKDFHHFSYDDPYAGAWICRSCHRKEHERLRRTIVQSIQKSE